MKMSLVNNIEQKIQDITIRLEQYHLIYLQTDDSPLKLEQRKKLEGLVEDYLCLVSNERKFIFKETEDILYRSAANFKEFSGYKACTGWSAIFLYATNLLSQPWRKEYRNIKTYIGYYKHEIEANLEGAEFMFELMGYLSNRRGVLTLNGPIDPDRVSNVSKDAIIAFVECKILKQIWEKVSSIFNISWLEILDFRKNYTGTADQAIRALNYRYLEKMKNQSIPRMYLRPQQTIDSSQELPLMKIYNNNDNILSNCLFTSKNNFPCQSIVSKNLPKQMQTSKLKEKELLSIPILNNCESYESNESRVSEQVKSTQTKEFQNNTLSYINSRTAPFTNNKSIERDPCTNIICSPTTDNCQYVSDLTSSKLNVEEKNYVPVNTETSKISEVTNNKTNEHSKNWNCETCTYLNVEDYNICQMCSKSRQKGCEEEPLMSGGKECPKCTLINKKNVTMCDACGTNLNNSPTYI